MGDDGTFSVNADLSPTTSFGSYQLAGATGDDIVLGIKVLESATPSGGGSTAVLTFERGNYEVIIVGLMAIAPVVGSAYLVVVSSKRQHIVGISPGFPRRPGEAGRLRAGRFVNPGRPSTQ